MPNTNLDRSGVEVYPLIPAGMFMRSFPLDDIKIAATGDGRTVEAYATVFGRSAEIRDHEGHYLEENDARAFDNALARAHSADGWRVGVFYNHGLTIHGTPSESGSRPLGYPLDIRADGNGLLTVTRYSKTVQADEILELIRDGAIRAQSYTGAIIRSTPELSRAQRRRGGYLPGADGSLQLVRRLELGLTEYGPTPMPAYADAAIVGVRSLQVDDDTATAGGGGDITDEDREELSPDESDHTERRTVRASAPSEARRRAFALANRARGITHDRSEAGGDEAGTR